MFWLEKQSHFLGYLKRFGVDSRLDAILQIIFKLSEMHKSQVLQEERYSDPKRLEKFSYKVYSQNEEDGIIAEIFNRIGCANKFFIEFGVQDGLECNTHFLLFQGWKGVFIEGSGKYCEKIKKNFKILIERSQLTLLNSFITAENINDLIGQTKAKEICEIDLLSIDIDGNDYHVFEAISVIKPRVVVIEFNAKFPPPVEYIMPYNPSHVWDGTDAQGASLESLSKLGTKKGYRLVATDLCGVNAFFVRHDLCGDKFPNDCSAKSLYNSSRLLRRSWFGHSNRYFLTNAAQSK